jgi:hypothetical protein
MLLKIRWIVISGINAMFFQALIALIFITIQWQLTDLVNVKREKWIASNFLSSVGVVVISFATVGSWLLPWG